MCGNWRGLSDLLLCEADSQNLATCDTEGSLVTVPWGLMWTVLFILGSDFALVSACWAVSRKQRSGQLLCFEFNYNGISDMDYFCDSNNCSALLDKIQIKYFLVEFTRDTAYEKWWAYCVLLMSRDWASRCKFQTCDEISFVFYFHYRNTYLKRK